jgi:hypothetical protein
MTTNTNAATRAPLRVVSMGDLLAHPFPQRDHLLFPWLREGESALLWAQTGIGKTMLAVTLALAVSGGGEFLGWRSGTPRPVLYLDGEMHAEDMRDRLRHLTGTVTGIDVEAAGKNLRVLSRQHQGDDANRFPDLASPEGQDMILATARDCGAALVILDNFSTLAEVADENDAAAMSPVLSFLLRLKAAGIACILVHHSGKSGETFRGSSKLATTFEAIIGLKALDGHPTHSGAAFELTWGKFRGAPRDATRNAEVRLVNEASGLRWDHRPARGEEAAALVEMVRSGRYRTQRELADALGWRPSKVTEIKQRAIREGRITGHEWKEQLEIAEPDAAADY